MSYADVKDFVRLSCDLLFSLRRAGMLQIVQIRVPDSSMFSGVDNPTES
jgi:hypothetical protein